MSMTTVKNKYHVHKAGAKRRDIPFTLTFEEWTNIWFTSGKWEQRGWGADKYCMCRYGDKGAYEVGNVYIATNRDNGILANTGRKHTDEMKFKSGASSRGKKQSPEHIAKRAAALVGKPSGMKGKVAWNKGITGSTRSKILQGE